MKMFYNQSNDSIIYLNLMVNRDNYHLRIKIETNHLTVILTKIQTSHCSMTNPNSNYDDYNFRFYLKSLNYLKLELISRKQYYFRQSQSLKIK